MLKKLTRLRQINSKKKKIEEKNSILIYNQNKLKNFEN